jgi:hypothetical protein
MTSDFKLSRRDVLRGLGGLALTGLTCKPEDRGSADLLTGSTASALLVESIAAIANRPVALPPGIHAYAQNSVAAGDTIDFHVSCPEPYSLSLVRLGWNNEVQWPRGWTVATVPGGQVDPQQQRVTRQGSYIHVERALPSATAFPELTLECWVRPIQLGWRGLITQYTYEGSCGYGLFIDGNGRPVCYFGDGGAFNANRFVFGTSVLPVREWRHLVAVFSHGVVKLYVNGTLEASVNGTLTAVVPGTSPLRLAAYGDATGTTGFLDGDLAMPVMYSHALTASEVSERLETPSSPATGATVLGCWRMREERGPAVADASESNRGGLIVNHATWMIGGPEFDASNPNCGINDPCRGNGLRFSSSDLYDCAWPVTDSYTIPSDAPPGIYAGRIVPASGGAHDVTFLVRRAATRPPARIAVLCPTNTWHAYGAPFGLFGFYRNHQSSQPPYYMGINMPWPSAEPNDCCHLVKATRYTQIWLEQNGYDFDVLGDLDLHANADVLAEYRTVIIAGHSEYWTQEMYDGVDRYLGSGGQLVCLSGNTMFWRVSVDAGVIECRKYHPHQGGVANSQAGELYHEQDDHFRGGLMRESDCPAWKVIGLECTGYTDVLGPYTVTNPTHDFFQIPESAGVAQNPLLGGAMAVGGEFDATVRRIPGHPEPLPDDDDPEVLAECRATTRRFNYGGQWLCGEVEPCPPGTEIPPTNGIVSEVIDWRRGEGGRVFAVGSIGAGAALHADRGLTITLRNALHHMGVVFNLHALAIDGDGCLAIRSFNGTSWDMSWTDLGGSFSSSPTGVMWAPGLLAAAAITTTGSLYYQYFDGASWSGWSDFGGSFQGQPCAVAWGRNRLTLFARTTSNELHARDWDGATWSSWESLGDGVASDPAAVSHEGNRLAVAVRGINNTIRYKYTVDGVWFPSQTTWDDLDGSFAGAPTMHAWNGNDLSIFAVNSAGRAFHRKHNGTAWTETWEDLGIGPVASRLAVAAWGPTQFTLFGRGQDHRMKNKWFDGNAWAPPTDWADNLGGAFDGDPVAVTYRGSWIELLAVGTDSLLKHNVWDGTAWSGWTTLGGNFVGSPAAFRSV